MSTNDGVVETVGLWTLQKVGEVLGGVHKRTVQRMIHRGELPPVVKVGRRPCLPIADVLAYIERLKGGRRS